MVVSPSSSPASAAERVAWSSTTSPATRRSPGAAMEPGAGAKRRNRLFTWARRRRGRTGFTM